MKKSHLICCILLLVSSYLYAGVQEYFIYDQRDRYQFESLDGVVSVEIKNYSAFSDIGLIKTLIEERKNADSRTFGVERRSESLRTVHGKERIYDSGAGKNEVLQVLRNSLWLFEAEIKQVHSGSFQTNIIYIVSKPTRAFLHEELPHNFLSSTSTNTIDFGLVRVNENEFKLSFQGLCRYLENDLRILDRGFCGNIDTTLNFSNDYTVVFNEFSPSPCYVAQEIGITNKENNSGSEQQSSLIKALMMHKK